MNIGGDWTCGECGKHCQSGSVHKCKPKEITVKEMINLLLDQNMNDIVIIRKDGERIHNAKISTKKKTHEAGQGLGALFG